MLLPDLPSLSQKTPDPAAAALRACHAELQGPLRASALGEPLYLRSAEGESRVGGEVFAELDHSVAEVAAVLQSGARLGELLFMHQNVRACHCSPAPDGEGERLGLTFGPKRAHAEAARYVMDCALRVGTNRTDYLRVTLHARHGPMATRNHRIVFEAVPLPAGRSFLRLAYSYDGAALGRLALQAYLASGGRDKIGFTTEVLDGQGRPAPVRGERGLLERNVVRFYLALKTLLTPVDGPADQALQTRLRLWHGLAERHAAQLHELDLDDYLHEKISDLAAGALDPSRGRTLTRPNR